ncbi:molybdopterin-guanine dinucleotide biosynthesis protein B [Paenibacillus campi]|uniref:molybdopterin-guanine dinucleotide biosynthesis protein B n=1 Tax=Paenibacillus campi TaxID=3106031 RepID=UPI002AFE5F20|nr:molybdopterin-guanine dinucleotide biosynthesis protein B [Paenibacillus sp. SGZ-1014]
MSNRSVAANTVTRPSTPIVQIVGYKNSGKTTLLTSLLRLFVQKGLRVAVIKHDAHQFQMDHPGTDTYAHTEAGAAAIAITSPLRTAIIREQPASLEQLIDELLGGSSAVYDLILIEGFKYEAYPKVVLVAHEHDMELLQKLTDIRWTYTRLEPLEVAAFCKHTDDLNLRQIPIISAGKDGIMDLFIALYAYIQSSQ